MYKASGKGATNRHRIDDDGTRWSRARTEVNRVADNFYYVLGLRIAQNPLKTLTICFCCVILCCLGFLNFAVVTRGESCNEKNPQKSYLPSITLRAFCVCRRWTISQTPYLPLFCTPRRPKTFHPYAPSLSSQTRSHVVCYDFLS